MGCICCLGLTASAIGQPGAQSPTLRVEHFDRDPNWDAHNNRPDPTATRTVRQDFGYSRTHNLSSTDGEIGGWITPAAEPAFYARKIPPQTFEHPFSASGTLKCGGGKFHVLLGLFNSNTLNEWRTPNTISIRLLGRGDSFFAYVEYGTQRWRAGGDTPGGFATTSGSGKNKKQLTGFALDTAYHWSLQYDPKGNGGSGSIKVTLGDQSSVCNLSAGHKADGAAFNRFGIVNVMKSAVKGGEVWLANLEINGVKEDLSKDPHWDGLNNRRTYETTNIRPQGDFGYSPTRFAGGTGKGELGGLIFRGDCRYVEMMASYGDRLSLLTLDKPLKASGRISLCRGVSDSATLIGFYHSKDSMSVNKSQDSILPRSFLGISIEGPSREGISPLPCVPNTFRRRRCCEACGQPSHFAGWGIAYLEHDLSPRRRRR